MGATGNPDQALAMRVFFPTVAVAGNLNALFPKGVF
jgi:hypothetical protein